MTTTTLPANAPSSRRTANVLLWVAQAVLALLFVFAGVTKLVTPVVEMQQGGMALPGALRIRQELTPLAAAGLSIIMAGAVVVTLMTPQRAAAVFPLVVGIIAVVIAYNRGRMLPR